MLMVIEKICQSIADIFWRFLLFLLPLCILISCGNAVMRKAFGLGSNMFLELQWYLFSAIFLIGAGSILKKDGHIRIDILYNRFPAYIQAWVNLCLHVCLTVPILIFLIYLSLPFFLASISPADHIIPLTDIFYYLSQTHLHEVSPNAGGLSTWYAKMLLPLGFALLLVAIMADICRHLRVIIPDNINKVKDTL